MTEHDDLDLLLQDWFARTAPIRPPEPLLDAVLWRTAHTPRRVAWRVADRWLSPDAWSRLMTVRRMALTVAMLALAAAAIVGGLLIAGSARRVPPPLGFARPGLIAVADEGRLVLVEPDGSDRQVLTEDGTTAAYPRWSPDGTKLAYWTLEPLEPGYGSPTMATLFVFDTDRRTSRVVDRARIPDSSPDLQAHTPSLRATGPKGMPPLVAWAPDSERLAYALPRDGTWRIFVTRFEEPAGPPIGDPALPAIHPDWSPDGTMIAFTGGDAWVRPAVYVMTADGRDVRRLTTGDRATSSPAWSPDGKTIAFTSGYACSGELWTVHADGSGQGRLAGDDAHDLTGQRWSPDGTMIAFGRHPAHCPEASVNGAVMVGNADGSDVRTLLDSHVYGSSSEWPLVWSPDGKSVLAFQMASGSSRGVAIVQLPLDGSAPVVIGMPGLTGQDGDWQRLAP